MNLAVVLQLQNSIHSSYKLQVCLSACGTAACREAASTRPCWLSTFRPAVALQETAARAEQAADSPSKVASESAAAGAHEALLAQHGVGELYVRLLCQFEPGSVLPFLQSHDAYRVEEVLPYTERFGVADAQVQRLPGLLGQNWKTWGHTLGPMLRQRALHVTC